MKKMAKKWFLTLVLMIGITVQSWSQLSVLNLQTGTPPADVLRSIGLSASQYTQLVNAAGGGYAGWESGAGGFSMWWAGRSENNRLAVENRLQRERIPSNRFGLYRQESHGAASALRYYEEGEMCLIFEHQDTSLIASLFAGTYQSYDNGTLISFSGNRFATRTPNGYFTGTVTITGRTFTLTEHNSRDNWLTGRWEILELEGEACVKDPDGNWWGGRISDTVTERPQNLSQAHRLFIERVGRMHADIFPQNRFTWNNANEILTFKSRGRDFTGTDWGFIHSPISFYKEMEVYFLLGNIIDAQWRYVYTSADPWFQIGGSPSVQNPLRSIWFNTAVPNNNVTNDWRGGGVINTLVHFESLYTGAKYTFRRGEGSNTTLTVKAVEGNF